MGFIWLIALCVVAVTATATPTTPPGIVVTTDSTPISDAVLTTLKPSNYSDYIDLAPSARKSWWGYYILFESQPTRYHFLRAGQRYQISRNLVDVDFIDIVPQTDTEAIQRMINLCAYGTVDSAPELPVKEATVAFVERVQSKQSELIKSSSVVIENKSKIQQEAHSEQYTFTESTNRETTITGTFGLKATAGFKIPLVGETKVEVSVGTSIANKKSETVTKSVTYPSQKVLVPPESRIRLTYHVYRSQFTTNYKSNFILDPTQDIIKKCINSIRYYPYRKPFLDVQYEDGLAHNNITGVFTEEDQILNNFPTTVVSNGFDIQIEISKSESLSVGLADTNAEVITIGDSQ